MLSTKLLLMFGVVVAILAQECSADIGIEDFTNKVVVANAGGTEGGENAFVTVTFDHGRVSLIVPPGKSRTAVGIASSSYMVQIADLATDSERSYRTRLEDLRDNLIDLSVYGYIREETLPTLVDEITNVQAALAQLHGSSEVQACEGKLEPGAQGKVTVEWRRPTLDEGVWVLDCN